MTDDYEAGYAEGFHHGRSTPAKRPVTDAQVKAALDAYLDGADPLDWHPEAMRDALEAAREAE